MSDNSIDSRMGFFCTEPRAEPFGLIIFGASGDLTNRKLVPALYGLSEKGLLPENFFILGSARSEMTEEDFRGLIQKSIRKSDRFDPKHFDEFSKHCFYLPGQYTDPDHHQHLKKQVLEFEDKYETHENRLIYLATPQKLFSPIVESLSENDLTCESESGRCRVSVIVEKPFGSDFDSARELDDKLHKVLQEHQIYRIDHYLAKETVQNILMFRFANAVFEPIWNRQYIESVHIDVTESLGVEERAGYFEQAGLLRDMFQNHMLQLLVLIGMEPPLSFEANRVRDEKAKLLRAIRKIPIEHLDEYLIRAQYTEGEIDGKKVPGYRQEGGVDQNTTIETYVAGKFFLDNWRWQGVPFYLRAGKRLPEKVTEISVVFKQIPYSIFGEITNELGHNVLTFNIHPEEAVSLTVQVKKPGPKLCMSSLDMKFKYREVFGIEPPEAYERLLLDCITGDQTLFVRSDSMEIAWSLLTPVLEHWEENPEQGLLFYPAGSNPEHLSF